MKLLGCPECVLFIVLITTQPPERLLAMAAAGNQFDYQGTGFCDPDCDYASAEFCGSDNTCYPYSCSNWYYNGPFEYVGHDGKERDSAGRLVVSPLGCRPTTDTQYEYGVVYGCSRYSNIEIPQGEGFGQGFTERCEARNSNAAFECYQMSSDTDFSAFLTNIDSNQVVCQNASVTPRYIYQQILSTVSLIVLAGAGITATFNQTMADRSIWAELSNPSAANPQQRLSSSLAICSTLTLIFMIFM
jgi:hypothetical protein